MAISKSFVLPATFPSSKNGLFELEKAVERIRPFDFSMVEYYCETCSAVSVSRLFNGYRSVFLAAALQKSMNLNLCTTDAAERQKAVNLLTGCLRFAAEAGAESVLINSGERPADERRDKVCLEYLKDSICELHQRVKEIPILLEPGDYDIQYRHLIGHTDRAVSFIEDMRREVPGIGLVFDISHIAQLKEDLYSSWEMAKEYCSHVHLANCVLDRNSPVFGDRHPLFSIPGGSYSHETAFAFYRHLQSENMPITAGIEMICSDDSEETFFERFSAETDWFFHYK